MENMEHCKYTTLILAGENKLFLILGPEYSWNKKRETN